MKKIFITSLFISSTIFAGAVENMIPADAMENSMNSWCTWGSQNGIIGKYKSDLSKGKKVPEFVSKNPQKISQRDGIGEAEIFGKDGMAHYYKGDREDMYFILDDGWDVDYYLNPWDKDMPAFGSHIANDKRFPSIAGKSPKKKLRQINKKLRAMGWKGAGLWIPAQRLGATKREDFELQKDFWKKRIAWSKYAGIKYWKVDWGRHCLDADFRVLLSAFAAEEYPELIIENALPIGGESCFANDIAFKDGKVIGSGEYSKFPKKDLDDVKKVLAGSRLFRTYDSLGDAITLDRMAYLLDAGRKNNWNFYLTCELHPKLAAGLASYFGEMRNNLQDARSFLRWQHIAPALAANEVDIKISKERLEDIYTGKDVHGFKPAEGKSFPQSAPAIVVRGDMDLPKIKVPEGKKHPFVVATLHPNSSLCIAFVERKATPLPLVEADVNVDCANRKIGIFGAFEKMTFNISKKSETPKVWIQELTSDTPKEIKKFEIKDGKFTLRFKDTGLPEKDAAFVLFVENK